MNSGQMLLVICLGVLAMCLILGWYDGRIRKQARASRARERRAVSERLKPKD